MDDLTELLAFVLSVIALFSIFVLLSVKVYFKIRRCFPISVNCWFCNSWTWVPYDNRNSFDCPGCLQYNGFEADGGYNKVIEAQHRFSKSPPSSSHKNSNGLCSTCNQNQQLKITQLAKFTPLIEENYDEEIEHFREQLEKAYELCKPCKKLLNVKLLREKINFLGNHVVNIQKKGVNIYERLLKKSQSPTLLQILKGAQGILAIGVILKISSEVLNCIQFEWFPTNLLPYLKLYQDFPATVILMINDYISLPFLENLEFDKLWVFSLIGLFIQLALFLMEETLMCIKINQLLCWSFLVIISSNKEQQMLMNSFQIVCASLIFYNSFFEYKTSLHNKIEMKKLPSKDENNTNDYSDTEDSTSYGINKIYNKKTENITANSFLNNVTSNLQTKTVYNVQEMGNGKRVISPSKLINFDQESWIAGGFWKSEDGTIIQVSPCKPESPKFAPVFSSEQFHSLPSSIETSLSGDFDRLSLAPKSRFVSPSASPPLGSSFVYASPNRSISSQNSWTSIRSVGKPKSLGLFKLETQKNYVGSL